MGYGQSKSLLDEPWRKETCIIEDLFSTKNEKAIRDEIEKQISEDRNILLVGPISHGKTSFINTVAGVFKNRITYVSHAGESGSSMTRKLKKYELKISQEKHVYLFDCMGLEREGLGVHIDDVVNMTKGHIPVNYQLDPESPLSKEDERFISVPDEKTKMHCVVYVIDAVALCAELTPDIRDSILELKTQLQSLDLPRCMLLTKIDMLCPEVEKKIENVYKSVRVKTAVETAHELFGIPENLIYPVRNYAKEMKIDHNANILILLALQKILNFAEDFVEFQKQSVGKK